MSNLDRRAFLRVLVALGGTACNPYASIANATTTALNHARVVILGGGFAGSTCARYLKLLAPQLRVVLVEPQPIYHTCPYSNLVIAGLRPLSALAVNYRSLRKQGIEVVQARASAINFDQRRVLLSSKQQLPFDRLVVAAGIDLKWNVPEGYDKQAADYMPHAWKAGPQTLRLRDQLRLLRNGDVVAISVPRAPFRCPPGPYERASLIAYFFKHHKPRCKILILDANEKFSKQALFEQAWQSHYPGMIERLSISQDGAVRRVAVKSLTLFTELDKHRVALANVIPEQQAATIARTNGLSDTSGWCPVDPRSFASKLQPHTYVLGDATLAEPMPKSASSANSQAKTCALAIVASLQEQPLSASSLHNTCYSLIDPDYGISINAIYHTDPNKITPVDGAGGISPLDVPADFRRREAAYTEGWYKSIVHDSFGI